MTPDDVRIVQHSWSALSCHRAPFLIALARRFDALPPSPVGSDERARWMYAATEELVDMLMAPSRLADRARSIAATWPDPLTAPSFAVEGRAWLAAAGDCLAGWSEGTEAAWRQAWLLLSEVLAAEALSPFADAPAHPGDERVAGGSS